MQLAALEAESDDSCTVLMVQALERQKFDAASTTLRKLAERLSEPDDLRATCCVALGRMGNADAVESLAHLLANTQRGRTTIVAVIPPRVRAAAAQGLGMFADNFEARDALRNAVKDPDQSVRNAATQALTVARQVKEPPPAPRR